MQRAVSASQWQGHVLVRAAGPSPPSASIRTPIEEFTTQKKARRQPKSSTPFVHSKSLDCFLKRQGAHVHHRFKNQSLRVRVRLGFYGQQPLLDHYKSRRNRPTFHVPEASTGITYQDLWVEDLSFRHGLVDHFQDLSVVDLAWRRSWCPLSRTCVECRHHVVVAAVLDLGAADETHGQWCESASGSVATWCWKQS
jgi:hypothetical protein